MGWQQGTSGSRICFSKLRHSPCTPACWGAESTACLAQNPTVPKIVGTKHSCESWASWSSFRDGPAWAGSWTWWPPVFSSRAAKRKRNTVKAYVKEEYAPWQQTASPQHKQSGKIYIEWRSHIKHWWQQELASQIHQSQDSTGKMGKEVVLSRGKETTNFFSV